MYLYLCLVIVGASMPVLSIPAPTPQPTAPMGNLLHNRQSLPELLALASEAGIALPTDPAALLSLYPVATQLVQYLPTEPVLSVLETAIPSGFISQVIHDPSFAASFEQAFETGAPPSWFNSLPTDVRSYLHTYQVGSLASEIGSVESGLATLPHSIIGQSQTGTARVGPLVGGPTTTGSSNVNRSISTAFEQSTAGGTTLLGSQMTTSSMTGTIGSTVSGAVQGVASATSISAAAVGTSTSMAGASRETGVLATGFAAAMAVFGAAALL